MHNSIINQCRHSVKERLNVSWSHFHSKSGIIKGRFVEGSGLTRVCVCVHVMIQWWPWSWIMCHNVSQHVCHSREGVLTHFELVDKGRLHCGYTFSHSHGKKSVSKSTHASMCGFYFGLAFEAFVLRVTLLPQSCRSAQLSSTFSSDALSSIFIIPCYYCSLTLPAAAHLSSLQPFFSSESSSLGTTLILLRNLERLDRGDV